MLLSLPEKEPKKRMSARKKVGVVFLVILVGIFALFVAAIASHYLTCDESCQEDIQRDREKMEQREREIARAEYLRDEKVKERERKNEEIGATCNQSVNEYLDILENALLLSSSRAHFIEHIDRVYSLSDTSFEEITVNLEHHCGDTLSTRQEIRMSLYADQMMALP